MGHYNTELESTVLSCQNFTSCPSTSHWNTVLHAGYGMHITLYKAIKLTNQACVPFSRLHLSWCEELPVAELPGLEDAWNGKACRYLPQILPEETAVFSRVTPLFQILEDLCPQGSIRSSSATLWPSSMQDIKATVLLCTGNKKAYKTILSSCLDNYIKRLWTL